MQKPIIKTVKFAGDRANVEKFLNAVYELAETMDCDVCIYDCDGEPIRVPTKN